jgi:hypothetical protein
MIRMLHYTHKFLILGGNVNSSFLALVPKESNPSSFSFFHPILLCNSSYNILTKFISYHLKILLPKIISPKKGGFMRDRHITDNIVIVQEEIHSSFSSKGKGMVIKLGMANAFDCVCHSFLFQVLKKFGFNIDSIKWVEYCIKGPWILPLVNGRLTGFFQSDWGLRQGFPLSPFLYIIMVDYRSQKL